MTPPKQQSTIVLNPKYQQAEELISQTIAEMDTETHVEYGATMERKSRPTRWKTMLKRLKLCKP